MLQEKREETDFLHDKLTRSVKPIYLRSAANLETFFPGASARCWLPPTGERSTTRLDITRGGPRFFGSTGKDGELIARGASGAFTDVLAGIGETPFGGGKSGDSTIIGGIEITPFGGRESGEPIIIGGIEATPPGGGKSGESTIIEGNTPL